MYNKYNKIYNCWLGIFKGDLQPDQKIDTKHEHYWILSITRPWIMSISRPEVFIYMICNQSKKTAETKSRCSKTKIHNRAAWNGLKIFRTLLNYVSIKVAIESFRLSLNLA